MRGAPEFSLIRRLTAALPAGAGVRVGLGDDAAVVDAPQADGLVLATDLLTEGVHFDLRYTPFQALGHKALAVNLSDLAAMGARPLWALVALAIPRGTPAEALVQLYDGLGALAREAGCGIVGGDTTAARAGALTVSIAVVGTMAGQPPLTRRGARPGDLIAVAGTLGGAAWALSRLSAGEALSPAEAALLFYPRPQLEAGRWLAEQRLPTAMLDVSDGLLGDLGHLLARGEVGAEASLGARIDLKALPLSPALARAAAEGFDPRPMALEGGEDYALLFTVPRERAGELDDPDAPPTTIIGEIRPQPGVTLLPGPGGRPPRLTGGWRHFREEDLG